MQNKRRKHSNRPYQIKKTGIKDENIDRQILALHKAMGQKLLAQPELVVPIQIALEEHKDAGHIGYGPYITWFSILNLIDNPKAFLNGLLEDTPKMRRLRRTSPLRGLLSEDERQQALLAEACGATSVETLL